MAKGTLINLAAFVSDPDKEGNEYAKNPQGIPPESLLEIFHDFEEEVQELLRVYPYLKFQCLSDTEFVIQCVDNFNIWPINTMTPLPIYTDGRVALIGDSVSGTGNHLNLYSMCSSGTCNGTSPRIGCGSSY